MKRVGFFLFYDSEGIVDKYIITLLEDLRKYIDDIVFVVNGYITEESKNKVKDVCSEILVRKNIGYDVWGYKEGIESFGYERLADYDEMILLNYTFFGPIYPFSEMFDKMDSENCDFWGIAAYDGIYGYENVGYFIQSMFIAYRKKLFLSDVFKEYWKNMPMIVSKDDLGNSSFLVFEAKFAEYFESKGFTHGIYHNPKNYPTREAFYLNVDMMAKDRCPILKRRVFLNDPIHDDVWCVNNKKALDIIAENSDYDFSLVWDNILRTTELRTVVTNAELFSILPDNKTPISNFKNIKKVAVYAHIYAGSDEADIAEMFDYVFNISVEYDLFISIENDEKIEYIKNYIKKIKGKTEIRKIPDVQDGDMASFFIEWKDVILKDEYQLLCKVFAKHIEKGINYTLNDMRKYHSFENLLITESFVSEIINCFDNEKNLGVICPPCPHMGTDIYGHTWKHYRQKAEEIATNLDFKIKFDTSTPLAAYGRMFWARPEALSSLIQMNLKYDDFTVEKRKINNIIDEELEKITFEVDNFNHNLDIINFLANAIKQKYNVLNIDKEGLDLEINELTKNIQNVKSKFYEMRCESENKIHEVSADNIKEWLGYEEPEDKNVDILAGALERLITYCAQNKRFYTRPVFSPQQAARNYVRLENKAELIYKKKNDFVMETLNDPNYNMGARQAFRQLCKALRISLERKGRLGHILIKIGSFLLKVLKSIYRMFRKR